MKANEAPEKLYFSATENGTHYYTEGIPFEREYVEYTRNDVIIEKACDWLERNGNFYIGFEQGQPCVTEELIKSLKKYLEWKEI